MQNNENKNEQVLLESETANKYGDLFKSYYGLKALPQQAVTITMMEYKQLLRIQKLYDLITTGILQCCELGYGADELRCTDDQLNTVLQLLMKAEYDERIAELKAEREERKRVCEDE